MSYVSLARKYRPRRFVDMVGQESTTLALTNAIRLRREPHSVIFTGVRGIGKTTSARIYAKALNCEQGPTAEPCDVCASCMAITAGNHEDVLEIDGASNTGVDDVRALQETLSYVPQRSTYKIYIIDEVHMLSISAFNALLKTLEEPPQHVVFIFATTELHKVPETIQSRCQVFHLQKMSRPVIAERIRAILHAEQIPFDEAALTIVAREGRGSMRDALTMLDQAIAVGGGQVSLDTLKNMVGGSQALPVLELLDGLLRKDAALILEVIARWDQEGQAMAVLVEETAKACRNAFILRDLKGQAIDLQILELEDREQHMLLELGEKALPMDLNRLFRQLAKCLDDLRHADLDRFVLENYCLEWCFDPGLPDLQTMMNIISGGQALPQATPKATPQAAPESNVNLRERWKTSAPAVKSPGSPPAPAAQVAPAPQTGSSPQVAQQKSTGDNKRPWTMPAPAQQASAQQPASSPVQQPAVNQQSPQTAPTSKPVEQMTPAAVSQQAPLPQTAITHSAPAEMKQSTIQSPVPEKAIAQPVSAEVKQPTYQSPTMQSVVSAQPEPVQKPMTSSKPVQAPQPAMRAGAMALNDDVGDMPSWALAASLEQELAKSEDVAPLPEAVKKESFLQQMAKRAANGPQVPRKVETPAPPPVEASPAAVPVWPDNWRAFVDEWKKQKPLQGRVLEEAYVLEYTPQKIRLAVEPQSMAGGKLLQVEVRKRLMEQFTQLFGFEGILEAIPKSDASVNTETILEVKHREREVARENLRHRLEEHPMTREVISRFGGTIEQIELQ